MENKKYEEGELITKCEPLAYVVDDSAKGIQCDYCLVESDKLKFCSVCKSMFYCNQTCQKKDWKNGHKHECHTFLHYYKKVGNKSMLIDFTNRMMIRVYNMVTKNNKFSTKKFKAFNGKELSFNDLEDHVQKITVTRKEMFKKVKHDLRKVDFKFDEKLLLSIYGKVMVHLFSIFTERMIRIGCGIYLEPSVFEHSCIPNIAQTFSGTSMIFRAAKEFAKDEKPVYSFINPMYSAAHRKLILEEQFHLTCECQRCKTEKPNDNENRYFDFKKMNDTFLLALSKEEYRDVIDLGKRILAIYDRIYPYPQAEVSVHLSRYICAYFDLPFEQRDQLYSVRLLTRTVDSFCTTHGRDHPLTREMANLALLYQTGYCLEETANIF